MFRLRAGSVSRSRPSAATLAFIGILVLAAFFRLAFLNLAEFKSDEAATSTVMAAFVTHGKFPLIGTPLSTGGYSGPVFYYILALPFLVSRDPLFASVFVALLNLAAIVLAFKFVREFFGNRIALMTVALDAVSPFAVLFSRKIWNPDLVFPFTVVLFYCLYVMIIKKRPVYIIPVLVSFVVLFQISPIALFLAPVIFLFFVRFYKLVKPKYLALGLVLCLLLFIPLIYGDLTKSVGETSSFASTLKEFSDDINPTVIQQVSSDTSGSGFDYIIGNNAGAFYASIFNVNDYFFMENLLLYLGVALVIVRASRDPFGSGLRYSLLAAWIGVPTLILLFFNPASGLWTHHVVMYLPANFMAVAVFLDFAMNRTTNVGPDTIRHLGRRVSRCLKFVPVALFISIIAVQIVFGAGFLNLLNTQGGTGGDYGVGLQYKMEVAQYIAHTSTGNNFTISSNLTPGDIGSEYYYLLSLYGKTPAPSGGTAYVIIDGLTGPDPGLVSKLSGSPSEVFGPLTVYVLDR